VADDGWHCRTDNVSVGAIPYGGVIPIDVLESVDRRTNNNGMSHNKGISGGTAIRLPVRVLTGNKEQWGDFIQYSMVNNGQNERVPKS
jgi:hypothetical protein